MNIIGLDIGYSNLKLAHGDGPVPQLAIVPSGAAPMDRMPTRYDGRAASDVLHVLVDGREYAAGIRQDRAELWSRALHDDYTESASYKALFHAGVLLSGYDVVDVLVTGLPVHLHSDKARVDHLVSLMQGVHQVTARRSVTVKKVKVVPQPIGGLLDYIAQSGEDIEDARVLVIDPGFFSVDWVLISRNEFVRSASGSSAHATSVLLEESAKLMAHDYGAAPSIEDLEGAIRSGKDSVTILGRRVDYLHYVEEAAKSVTPLVADTVKKSMRAMPSPDIIVLVGGGASYYNAAITGAFDPVRVVMPDDCVYSNARGFWHMGVSLVGE